MDEIKEKRRRVREAERVSKEADRAYKEASDQIQAVLKEVEEKALREFNEDIEPFLNTYRVATATAFKKAQDDSVKIGATLGVHQIEAYKELYQAREELQEANLKHE